MRRRLTEIVLLMGLALIPAIAAGLLHPNRPAWSLPELTEGEVHVDLAKEWGQAVLWIDARSRAAFDKQHVPGAVLLNEHGWNDLLPAVIERWTTGSRIVIYCGSRDCHASHNVRVRLMREMKWRDVWILHGGWEAWKESLR